MYVLLQSSMLSSISMDCSMRSPTVTMPSQCTVEVDPGVSGNLLRTVVLCDSDASSCRRNLKSHAAHINELEESDGAAGIIAAAADGSKSLQVQEESLLDCLKASRKQDMGESFQEIGSKLPIRKIVYEGCSDEDEPVTAVASEVSNHSRLEAQVESMMGF